MPDEEARPQRLTGIILATKDGKTNHKVLRICESIQDIMEALFGEATHLVR